MRWYQDVGSCGSLPLMSVCDAQVKDLNQYLCRCRWIEDRLLSVGLSTCGTVDFCEKATNNSVDKISIIKVIVKMERNLARMFVDKETNHILCF